MNISDIDWRMVLKSWSEADILYLRSLCDEKLRRMPKRRTIIVKGEG